MNSILPEDFTRFQFLSNLRLAEDGKHAAFVVRKADLDQNSYTSSIWLADTKTGAVRQLTAMKDESSYLWLDNETLLFASGRDKQEEKEDRPGESETVFYRIRIDGGEGLRAFSIPLAVGSLYALPDGRFLFSAPFDNNAPDYAGMEDSAKADARKTFKEEQDYQVLDEIPFWANGSGFTNKKRNRLWTFDPATEKTTPLTAPLMEVDEMQLDEGCERVVFTGNEFSDQLPVKGGLYCCDLLSGSIRTLVPPERYNIAFACFYQGRTLMMASEGQRCGLNENACLYQVDPDGTVTLLQDADLSYYNSVGSDCRLGGGREFLARGDSLTAIVTDRSCSRLVSISGDGSYAFLTAADGSVDCFDRQDKLCLFIGMRNQHLQELYQLDLTSGAEKKLTSFNDAVLEDRYIASPQPLTFTDSDGVEIDGWVLLPKDYDPAGRYPAILDIHGGPKTVYGTVYYHEMQLWAGKGYFVLYANPRGGDGRGNVFSDIRGKYGTVDYRDLMEFTDRVLEAYPAIDQTRIGVTGGSYGGFMTNWIIGHTNRFAAAASQRSIANWISMSYTTDIGYFFGPDQTGGTPWDNPELMWEQSPLKYADRCQTPTLFIHSDQDYRCWMAEGLQLFTALKVHGVESRLCLFKGETHELSRSGKPRHRIRRLLEITNWFDRHLS